MNQNTRHLTDRVPPPEEIRERLAANLKESRILRKLLRLSERVARERPAAEGGNQ